MPRTNTAATMTPTRSSVAAYRGNNSALLCIYFNKHCMTTVTSCERSLPPTLLYRQFPLLGKISESNECLRATTFPTGTSPPRTMGNSTDSAWSPPLKLRTGIVKPPNREMSPRSGPVYWRPFDATDISRRGEGYKQVLSRVDMACCIARRVHSGEMSEIKSVR